MRQRSRWATLVITALLAIGTQAPVGAQSFTNLDFEAPGENFTFNLPGWTLTKHVQPPHLGVVHLLYSAPAPAEWNRLPPPFPPTNEYSLSMQVGYLSTGPGPADMEIDAPTVSQTGLIPAGTQSIRLRAWEPDPFNYHEV